MRHISQTDPYAPLYQGQRRVIACATVIEEMLPYLPTDVPHEVLDFGLHLNPNKLKTVLQEKIDQASQDADVLLLGYGLCSMAVIGLKATNAVLVIPRTVGFALAGGLMAGIFQSYLNSAQQIFQEQYALGDKFPAIFAIISLALGIAAFTNASLVMRLGMRKLVNSALTFLIILSCVFLAAVIFMDGHPPLVLFIAYLMMFFFGNGVLRGNMNTIAMQPLAHLAGIGAAAIGSFATFMGMALGTLIGRAYNGTVTPLVIGMVVLTGISILVARWAQTHYDESDEEEE